MDMSNSYHLLLIIFIAGKTVEMSLHYDHGVKNGDFCQFDKFTANCSSGLVLMVDSAFYGRMKIGRCIKKGYDVLNCTADVLKVMDWNCSGKESCELEVVYFSLHGIHPCSQELTSYLEVTYRCVQVEQLHTVGACNSPSLLFVQPSQSGHLSVPAATSATGNLHFFHRESNFASDSCGWTLTAPKGHKISLSLYRFVDPQKTPNKTAHQGREPLSLPRSDSGGPDPCGRRVVLLRDKTSGREASACAEGDRRTEDIFLSDGNSVDVIVAVTSFGSRERHLIKYQVTSCLTPSFTGSHVVTASIDTVQVLCNSTGEKWTLTCLDSSWTGVVGSCPDVVGSSDDLSTASMWSTITNEWKSPKGLTLVICLGVLLGIAVGMIMLSFAICLIKQKPRCLSEGDRPVDLELYEEAMGGPRFCPMRFTTASPPTGHRVIGEAGGTTLNDPSHYWDGCIHDTADKCSFGRAPTQANSFAPSWQNDRAAVGLPAHLQTSVGSKPLLTAGKSVVCSEDGDSIRKVYISTPADVGDGMKMDGTCPDVVRALESSAHHPPFQTLLYAERDATSTSSVKTYEKSLPCVATAATAPAVAADDQLQQPQPNQLHHHHLLHHPLHHHLLHHHHRAPVVPLCSCSN